MNTKLLKQKILDLAIRGKLVPQDPNDEPASELHKRIRAEKEKLIAEGKIKRSKKTGDKPHYENMPFEIPSNWEWVRIGDVFSMQAGKNISAIDISSEKVGNSIYPCYGGNGLRGYVKTFNNDGAFPIIGRQGALCGNVNIVEGKFYATEHAVVTNCYNVSDVHWAFYFLIALNLNQYATATAQPGLAVSNILSVLMPLPPYCEQIRIVSAIEHMFALIDSIENEGQRLQKAINLAKSKILDLAIHGKLVSQDPNDEPASELLKRIAPYRIPCDTSHYGNIPENWAITTMSNLCKIIDGEKQSNIKRIYLDVKYLRGKSDGEYMMIGKYVPANSTMILVDGENSGEIFTTTIDGYQGSTFKILDISKEMYKPFVLYIIMSYQKQLRENKVGSAIPHLNKKLFKEIVVEVPPYEEQKRIVSKIDELFSYLITIKADL